MIRRNSRKRRLGLQLLEMRRVLAASFGWDGPGLGSAELTYHIANHPSSLSQSEVNTAIETALNAWSSVADISFTPTNQSGLRDSIDISFTNIDGPGRTLAQAYFPDDVNPARIAGDIQFDSSEVWEIGNSLANRAFDLVWVAVHEIGHSLGLDHLTAADSVLAPFVSPSQQFVGLSASDITAIQRVYAAPSDSGVTTVVPPVDGTPVNDTPTDNTPTNDPGDTDNNPFPRNRWRRGGRWHGFGGRLESNVPASHNLDNPTDVNGDNRTTAIDALVIINQISRAGSSSSEQTIGSGMCDTNGDGEVSALDALTVINAMNRGSTESEILAPINEVDDTNMPVDDTNVPVDDTNVPVDDTNVPVDDTDVPVDDTDVPADDTDEQVDDTDLPTDPVDDGGLTDDDDGAEGDCDHGHFGHGNERVGVRFLRDPAALLARYDANDDGVLTEDEVPASVWSYLIDNNFDSVADGSVTLAEIETAVAALRAERFMQKDANSDGLLQQDEVSARFWAKISSADTNGDEGVSMEELDVWLANQADNAIAQHAEDHRHIGFRGINEHRMLDLVFAQLGHARFARR